MTLARFPISGPIANPTADDYDLEAALLRQEGAALARDSYHQHGHAGGHGAKYELARRFAKVARRLRWHEGRASGNRQARAA